MAWAVSHSVDDAVGIVADQKCTALRHRQTDGPCDMRLAVVDQEAGQEGLKPDRLAGVETNPHHLVARRRLAVPGTAHRHEGVPPVSCRELLAGVEQHLHGGRVGGVAEHHGLACRRPLLFADLPWRGALGIHPVLAPDVGPTILLSFLNAVELLGLLIVAQVVDAVIHPPQLPRFGVPSKADGVPQAAGKDGPALAIRRGPQQRRMLGIGLVARVTGRAHADVEHLIRAKGQRAVGVLTAIGQVVDDPFLWTQRAVRAYGGAIHASLAVATYSCPLAMASPCAPGREKTTFGSASKAPSSLASSSNSTSP